MDIQKPFIVCGLPGCRRVKKTINKKVFWLKVTPETFKQIVERGSITSLCDNHQKIRDKALKLAEKKKLG